MNAFGLHPDSSPRSRRRPATGSRLLRATLAATMVLLALPVNLVAQTDAPDPSSAQVPDAPRFYLDALNFSSDQPGQGRLDVYVEVPYQALHFARGNNTFQAAYDVTVDVHDSTDKLVVEKFWTERIETQTYEESVSPQAGRVSQKTFLLPPGIYAVAAQVTDHDSRKTARHKSTVTVRDFSRSPFAISDLMLVNHVDTVGGKKVVSPNIAGNVAEVRSSFWVFFELYNRVGTDSARIIMDVRNMKGDLLQSDTATEPAGSGRKSAFVRVRNDKLLAGDYTLAATARPLHAAPGNPVPEAAASRFFVIHWQGLPTSIVDLDVAIEQLQYMADKEKIDEMKDAPPEKKADLFREFWKRRDPTPATERNELMEEYYARVAYANKHFSHYVEGWKTDMGMVYIIFGTPSNIERHPFDIDAKPYEVWTYYEQNREFVFIDATGFGDYRLQNPVWDLWRTRPH